MTPEAWSALASAVGVVVAITAIIVESRRSRFSQGIDVISRLDATFDSTDFREKRRYAARWLQAPESGDPVGEDAVRDVMNFFETLGFLHRKKVIDAEAAWHYFGAWLLPYYKACAEYRVQRQQRDKNAYREIEPLYDAVFKIEEQRCNYLDSTQLVSKDAIAKFLDDEAHLPQKVRDVPTLPLPN